MDLNDFISTECIRTFDTVSFPANYFLKREQAELSPSKTQVQSIKVQSRYQRGQKKTWTTAPFDLMYGFRPNVQTPGTNVLTHKLSPWEMMRIWRATKIESPKLPDRYKVSATRTWEMILADFEQLEATRTKYLKKCIAEAIPVTLVVDEHYIGDEWTMITKSGLSHATECLLDDMKIVLEPGIHYVAIPKKDRLLMPCGLVEEKLQHPLLHMFYNDRSHGSVFCPVLQDLRHRWCWEWLQRPCVPFWNKQETWHPKKSVEDNSRLLSIYLRSWCLDKQLEMSDDNPLIENLSNNKNQYTEVWQNYVSSNKASPIAKQYIQQAVQQCMFRTRPR